MLGVLNTRVASSPVARFASPTILRVALLLLCSAYLQGGIVKLRLNDTIRVKGMLIPKGQLFFCNASITNQRLLLEIKNIRLGNAIIPVNLVVYSLDGLPGMNAPGCSVPWM